MRIVAVGDDPHVRRRTQPKPEDAVVELLQGIGLILMEIDAKLAKVIRLLDEEDDDGDLE